MLAPPHPWAIYKGSQGLGATYLEANFADALRIVADIEERGHGIRLPVRVKQNLLRFRHTFTD
jgi:hypothetical protein